MSLVDHLLKYEIRHFDGDDYWQWGGTALGRKKVRQLEKLRKPLVRGNPKKPELFAFYEYISDPLVASVVHSMKADAIRATGEFVSSKIDGQRILDVGCGVGYLTTWYALNHPDSEIVGIDYSPSTIATANAIAHRLGVKNVKFTVGDPCRTEQTEAFDTIVDTQGCIDIDVSTGALTVLFNALTETGHLISVPAFGNEEVFDAFVSKLISCRINLHSCDWVHFSDLGKLGAFPALRLSVTGATTALSKEQVFASFQGGLNDFRSTLR